MIKTKNIFLTSIFVITACGALPAFAADSVNPPVQTLEPIQPKIDTSINVNPKDVKLETFAAPQQNKNILQQAGDLTKQAGNAVGNVATKGAQAVGNAATGAWNGTKNFVSGVFGGSEPCSDDAEKKLKDANPCPSNTDAKCTDSLVEKTKLDTKQSGTDGKNDDAGKPKAGKCVVSKCIKGYTVNDAKTGCEKSQGDCTDTAKGQDSNATAGELKKGKCIITECGYGYHPSDDGTKCEQAELSEPDSKQKVDDLKANAQNMKDKEQSTANKLLGGAAIGATGIGAMNLMSGMAEQKSDQAAEEDMKAYLATFVCDYGRGRNIKGGEMNIDLPGGNDLLASVTEYRALAADLKVRKEALGKQPGIESDVIYDIAETGLYDNEGLGRQSGAFTSLSRALMDENSADAAAWAQQKADTASQVKTGAIVAGAGAIGGLIGNLAINSGDKNKNKADKIIADYDKKKQQVRKELKPVEDKSKQDAQAAPVDVEEGKDKDDTPKQQKNTLKTIDSTAYIPQQTKIDTSAVQLPPPTQLQNVHKPLFTLYNQSLFDSGKYELKDPAHNTLNEVIKTLTTQIGTDVNYKIILAAHTDRDKISVNSKLYKEGITTNEQLAQKRGDAVKDYLVKNSNGKIQNNQVSIVANGDTCATGTTAKDKSLDRKVDFYLLFDGEALAEDHNYCDTKTEN